MTCMNEQLPSGQVLGELGQGKPRDAQERSSAINWRRVFVHATRFGRCSGHGGSGIKGLVEGTYKSSAKRMGVDADDDKGQENRTGQKASVSMDKA